MKSLSISVFIAILILCSCGHRTTATDGSFTTSTGVSAINSPHYFYADLIFDCLTSGVFQLQYTTEVASSAAQMNLGSCMIIETLN